MNKITLVELNTENVKFESEFIRVSMQEKRVAIMLKGNFNVIASKLQDGKIFNVKIEAEGQEAIEFIGTTKSYNFILSSSYDSSNDSLVVCDNTLLIEINE